MLCTHNQSRFWFLT